MFLRKLTLSAVPDYRGYVETTFLKTWSSTTQKMNRAEPLVGARAQKKSIFSCPSELDDWLDRGPRARSRTGPGRFSGQ